MVFPRFGVFHVISWCYCLICFNCVLLIFLDKGKRNDLFPTKWYQSFQVSKEIGIVARRLGFVDYRDGGIFRYND